MRSSRQQYPTARRRHLSPSFATLATKRCGRRAGQQGEGCAV